MMRCSGCRGLNRSFNSVISSVEIAISSIPVVSVSGVDYRDKCHDSLVEGHKTQKVEPHSRTFCLVF